MGRAGEGTMYSMRENREGHEILDRMSGCVLVDAETNDWKNVEHAVVMSRARWI